jgi:hypothetical protein
MNRPRYWVLLEDACNAVEASVNGSSHPYGAMKVNRQHTSTRIGFHYCILKVNLTYGSIFELLIPVKHKSHFELSIGDK